MSTESLPRWLPSAQNNEGHERSRASRIGQICLLLLAICGLLSILHHIWNYSIDIQTSSRTCSCGSSPQEAASRGCKFDVLAMAWLPPHCRDDDLMNMLQDLAVEQNHTWTYYTYPNATAELSAQEVSLLAGDPHKSPDRIVTTMDWHHSHCLYLIWKQARASQRGTVMEGRYVEEKHQMHCMKSVLKFVATVPESAELLAVSQVDLYPD